MRGKEYNRENEEREGGTERERERERRERERERESPDIQHLFNRCIILQRLSAPVMRQKLEKFPH